MLPDAPSGLVLQSPLLQAAVDWATVAPTPTFCQQHNGNRQNYNATRLGLSIHV